MNVDTLFFFCLKDGREWTMYSRLCPCPINIIRGTPFTFCVSFMYRYLKTLGQPLLKTPGGWTQTPYNGLIKTKTLRGKRITRDIGDLDGRLSKQEKVKEETDLDFTCNPLYGRKSCLV